MTLKPLDEIYPFGAEFLPELFSWQILSEGEDFKE
jgi:hypothetical protein